MHRCLRTLTNENPHTDHALDRTQARHAHRNTRERAHGWAMLEARVTTAGGAATRARDAHPPERVCDTKWGATHTGQGRPGRGWEELTRTQKSQEATHGRVCAPSGRETPRLAGVSPSRPGCAGGKGMRTQRSCSHSRRHTEGPTFAERGHRTKGTHPLGPTKAVPHTPRAPAPRPTQTHSGHHRERRTHPHTHHTPTEGVWRAPLPGHLGCSATM